ncbi:hypothetical protein QJQ45_020791 [Haematococcus lacustris]|nr:hypothetical protein QJQ45_020791 [Haematococcus lacustris]
MLPSGAVRVAVRGEMSQGLDNAGKTTIVKRLNGEDITTISPTLGFNIKSMSYRGFKLNIWDVGGQKTLRPYWRNYFEKTDGLIWVVDSAGKPGPSCEVHLGSTLSPIHLDLTCVRQAGMSSLPFPYLSRLEDCRAELAGLLQEERLFGATLLIFANKQDIPSALGPQELEQGVDELGMHIEGEGEKRLVIQLVIVAVMGYDRKQGYALDDWTSQVLKFEAITKRHCRVVACSAVSGSGLLAGFDWLVQDISSRIYLFDH